MLRAMVLNGSVSRRRHCQILPIILMLLAGTTTSAQSLDIEVFGGVALWGPSQNGVYDATYTPGRVSGINTLFEDPDPRSIARQSLAVDVTRGLAAGLGVNLFVNSRWGFQFLTDLASLDLEGENAPHEVTLTYTTVNFPFSNLVDRNREISFTVPVTSGTLNEKVFNVNGIVRIVKDGPVAVNVSAGVSYFRLDGDIAQLGAFAAWFGGHAVLFSEFYEIGVTVPSTNSVGFNIGGDLAFPLGERLALFADVRVFGGGETETALVFDRMLSENVVQSPLADIEAFLDLAPLRLDPGFTRVLAGLRWRPW